jgi:hypothetical protein
MSYKLFLDDYRRPSKVYPDTLDCHWVWVKSYKEFVREIESKGLPKFISFDHDLAEEHYNKDLHYRAYKFKTGLDCAKWLVIYCKKNKKSLPSFNVHSLNPYGKQAILNVLD